MIRTVRIGSPAGLHARAAAEVAAVAARLPVPVRVGRAGREVPADSVLGLLTLGATHGTELTLAATGDGAAEAVDALAGLLAQDLDAARA
jgi:phosphocarrier protein HPr